jgi:predicted ribosome quality control (RQC) complex YloA/Tae2 family protein
MPFDALVMRGVTHRLAQDVLGSRIRFVGRTSDALYLSGDKDGARWHVRIVLTPALVHLCAVPRRPDGVRPWSPLHEALNGARVESASQPPWERVWELSLHQLDDIGRPLDFRLVIELAGHLTNAVLVRSDGAVFDAWRRVEPGRPGRAVWPGLAYVPPPALQNPCETGRPEHLPPWARRFYAASIPTLCQAWDDGQLMPYLGPGDRGLDVWIAPWDPRCVEAPDWAQALEAVYRERREALALSQVKGQLRAQLLRRQDQVDRQLSDARRRRDEQSDAERFRRLGDAILAFGMPQGPDHRPDTLFDPSSGETYALAWSEVDGTWGELAQWAYRRYQKARATNSALAKLIPRLERDRAAIQEELYTLERETDPKALQSAAKSLAPGRSQGRKEPFRRFQSRRGMEIWVGRTAIENQELTFRAARPDDLWFHVKQYPGSHVLLRCGKTPPRPEDIDDAAQLAALYSRAGKGSQVAVDFTARKFVRKRPHAEPGAVLYTRERTLYVTPDAEALRRLGAVNSLVDDD